MKVYLVQHGLAKSEKEDPRKGLTPQGRENTKKIGKLLHQLHVQPDLILTSPKKRAKETALIFQEELGISSHSLQEEETLAGGKELKEVLSFLEGFSSLDSFMIVSHLPLLEKLAYSLCSANIAFQNSAPLFLEIESIDQSTGQIVWYIPTTLVE